jgi:hypothetical protein
LLKKIDRSINPSSAPLMYSAYFVNVEDNIYKIISIFMLVSLIGGPLYVS